MIVVQVYVLVQMFYHVDVFLFFMDSFFVDNLITLRLKVVDFITKESFSALNATHDFEQLD
jgi:hypothetical protein